MTVCPRGSRPGSPYDPSCSSANPVSPVSSISSRATARSSGSFSFTNPPGSAHAPLKGGRFRLMRRIARSSARIAKRTVSAVTAGRGYSYVKDTGGARGSAGAGTKSTRSRAHAVTSARSRRGAEEGLHRLEREPRFARALESGKERGADRARTGPAGRARRGWPWAGGRTSFGQQQWSFLANRVHFGRQGSSLARGRASFGRREVSCGQRRSFSRGGRPSFGP